MHRCYEDLGANSGGFDSQSGTVHSGLADLSTIAIADGTQVYLCGPMPSMLAVRESLLARKVPTDASHYEVFGPDSWAGAPQSA